MTALEKDDIGQREKEEVLAIFLSLADVVGVDRIMMGSDSPFPIGDDSPLDVVAKAGFSANEVSWINGGLAAQLFELGA